MFELPSTFLVRLAAGVPALFVSALVLAAALVLWRVLRRRESSPFAPVELRSPLLALGALSLAAFVFFAGGLPASLYESAAESQKPALEKALESRYHLHSMEFALVDSSSTGFSYVVRAAKSNDETISFTVESQGAVAVVRPLGTE